MGKKYRVTNPNAGISPDEEFELLEIVEVYRMRSETFPEVLIFASWTEQIDDSDGGMADTPGE